MLIIGDAAIKAFNPDKQINSIEIIYTTDQLTYIKNYLNLKSEIKVDGLITRFENNKGVPVFLYNANKDIALLHLLKESFADNFTFKMASTTILYRIFRCKIAFRYYSIVEWERNMQDYLFLETRYFNAFNKYGLNKSIVNLRFKSSQLIPIFGNILKIKPRHPAPNIVDSHLKLLKIFKITEKPNYERLLAFYNEPFFKNSEWDRMPYDTKLNTILEKTYCEVITNYIKPEVDEFGYISSDPITLFKRTLMDSINNFEELYYKQFTITNYYEIIGNINENYYNLYQLHLKKMVD